MEGSKKARAAIEKAVDTAFIPLHAAVSKSAQKAYLSTFLFVTTSLFLFGISSIAYTIFYYSYVPQIGVERVIHLQDANPHGTVSIASALTSFQAYDISLFLRLPRTPRNLAAGNFMLDLSLLPPNAASASATVPSALQSSNLEVIARSRRPAILTYASPIIHAANTISGLPWYVMGWKKESEVLEVSMFEGVEFMKGWKNVPQSVQLIIDANERMQFYEVEVKIVAKFGGLRWILHHHRIFSYLFFTAAFWSSSMASALLAWLFLSSYLSESSITRPNGSPTKSEPSDSEPFDPLSTEDFSDTSHSFPTLGRQMPIHFSRRDIQGKMTKDEMEEAVAVKREEEKEAVARAAMYPPAVGEALDEDEDEDGGEGAGWRDSGMGTSLDDGERGVVQRRRRALFGGGNRGEGEY